MDGEKKALEGSRIATEIREEVSASVANLAKHGIADGDRITHFCGLPFPEYVASGGELCCEQGDPQSLTLTIERSGTDAFDVRVTNPAR